MIRLATKADLPALTAMSLLLWPENDPAEMAADIAALMDQGAAYFLAFAGGTAAGFAQCQLRREYVEGTESSPVGYLEGIFVREDCRRQGVARNLLHACETWAKEQGCKEFASDCELDNTESLRFHLAVGFAEANRIICFTKAL